jgi:hypothetical protein
MRCPERTQCLRLACLDALLTLLQSGVHRPEVCEHGCIEVLKLANCFLMLRLSYSAGSKQGQGSQTLLNDGVVVF